MCCPALKFKKRLKSKRKGTASVLSCFFPFRLLVFFGFRVLGLRDGHKLILHCASAWTAAGKYGGSNKKTIFTMARNSTVPQHGDVDDKDD